MISGQNSVMGNFVKTDDILKDMCGIIESAQKAAYQAVNTALVQRNWLIGYRIAEEEFGGGARSEYGLKTIKNLSEELTNRYGKGYDRVTLYRCLKFYRMFPEIVATAWQQSGSLLSWSHYRIVGADLGSPHLTEKCFIAVLLPYASDPEEGACEE